MWKLHLKINIQQGLTTKVMLMYVHFFIYVMSFLFVFVAVYLFWN